MDFEGRRVGVMAASDRELPRLNYDQCFVRDFAVCASAFLLRGDTEIVRNFLVTVLRLQSREHALEALQPRKGLMPASFRPATRNGARVLKADYGEESIARVTPADSVFWWLLTLRAYTEVTGNNDLAEREEFQEGIRLILRLVLEGSFEMFPTLLVPDGAFMIDRRMGVYGHPLEVQALFFAALRASLELLSDRDELRESVERRLRNLRHHVSRFDGDGWPEYYDGHRDAQPGERARRMQSWSMAAYLYAKACLRDAGTAKLYAWPDQIEAEPLSPDTG